MKHKPTLYVLAIVCLIALAVFAANPTFQSFNQNQFSASVPANDVSIKIGAGLTNPVAYGTLLYSPTNADTMRGLNGSQLDLNDGTGFALFTPNGCGIVSFGTATDISDSIGDILEINAGSVTFNGIPITGGGGTNGGLPGDGVFIKTNSLTQLTINTNANSQATAWVLQLALASIQSNTFFVSFTNVSGPVSGIGATTNNGTNLIVWQTNAPAGSTNGLAPLTNGIFSGASNAATLLPFADTSVTNGLASQAWTQTQTNLVRLWTLAQNYVTSAVTNGLASIGFVNTSIASANTNSLFKNVLLYGVVNDGITDNTTALNTLFSTNGSCWYMPPGVYMSKEVYITNGVNIYGTGATATYILGPTETNIFYLESLNTNIVIDGLTFDGQQYPNYAANTNMWFGFDNSSWGLHPFTLAEMHAFNYWQPQGLRHGLQFNTDQIGSVRNVTVKGFNGIGVLPLGIGGSTNGMSVPKCQVTSMNICSNFMGMWCAYPETFPGYFTNWQTNYVPNAAGPEYQHYIQLNVFCNVVGVDPYAANSVIDNSHFNLNYVGILDNATETSLQNNHGIIADCLINHTVFAPLFMYGITQGEIIANCFFAGDGEMILGLDSCTGVTLENCMFENDVYLYSVNKQGPNWLLNNQYVNSWAANVAPHSTNDGGWLCSGNTSYTIAGDSDGSFTAQVAGQTNAPTIVLTNTFRAGSFIGPLSGLVNSGPGSNNFDRIGASNLTILPGGSFYTPIMNISSLGVNSTNAASGQFLEAIDGSGHVAFGYVPATSVSTNGAPSGVSVLTSSNNGVAWLALPPSGGGGSTFNNAEFTSSGGVTNLAYNLPFTNFAASSFSGNALIGTFYSPYSFGELNYTNASSFQDVFQTTGNGNIESLWSFGSTGYAWIENVTSNSYQLNDINGNLALQLTNTGGTNKAKIGGDLTVGGSETVSNNLTVGGTIIGNGSGLTNLQYTTIYGAVWLNTASSPTTYTMTGPARLYITNTSTVYLVANGTTNTITGIGSTTAPEKVEVDQIGTNFISSY